MLGKNLDITEKGYGEVEVYKKYTIRVKYMPGDADAYTHEEYGFEEQESALECYALWSGIAKLQRCYDGVAAYAKWIIQDIERERAFIGDWRPEYFIGTADEFSDRFDDRLVELEDGLMNEMPTDSTSFGDIFASCETVELLIFDEKKMERREMSVSNA